MFMHIKTIKTHQFYSLHPALLPSKVLIKTSRLSQAFQLQTTQSFATPDGLWYQIRRTQMTKFPASCTSGRE